MDEKDKYLSEVRRKSRDKNLYIYGAGRKGIGLLKLLNESEIFPKGFLVSNASENKDSEEGLPVIDIHDYRVSSNETLVLIGVRKRWISDVIETLNAEGYKDYIEPPEGIEYLLDGDLERSRHSVLQITTQIGCRIDCKYCPQTLFIKKYTEDDSRELVLTLRRFMEFIDRTEKDVIIDFAGFSEPFFNPDCIEMIRYADVTGHSIELFTTLLNLERSAFEKIRNIPFREVVLHIPDQKQNSKIPITEEYLELLKVIMEAKKPDGRPFADWASCHGKVADEVSNLIEGRIRVITQLHDRAGNLGSKELEKQTRKEGPIRCSNTDARLHNHNVLLPDGTVILCDSDWGMRHILGNLKHNTYKEILHGQKSEEVQRARESENGNVICRNCCYAVPSNMV